MLSSYVPIVISVVVATGFAIVTLLLTRLINPSKYNKVKLEPYECGIEPVTDARDRYSIRYYLVAMLFVIFDVETVFLFPWAVIVEKLGIFGLVEMGVFLLIIATLMIPPTIILVPVFLVINQVGLLNSLWGVILPAVATPTGVFLLRQYMLTIPDELIEAARMDHASEWRIYWRIILPSLRPVFFSTLMVVAILYSREFRSEVLDILKH